MLYSAAGRRDPELSALEGALGDVARSLGMRLVELGVFRGKGRRGLPGAVRVRAALCRPPFEGPVAPGSAEIARAHRAMLPVLEGAFPGRAIHAEVSSPGIGRFAKDGEELALYAGRRVRCWRTDISDWTTGLLEEADERGIILKAKEGTIRLEYGVIAKAGPDPSQEG